MEEIWDTAAFIRFSAQGNNDQRMFLLGWVAGLLSDEEREAAIKACSLWESETDRALGRLDSVGEFVHDPRD